MSRPRNTKLAHMEATANTVIGVVIGQYVLFVFGIPVIESVPITAIIIALSYVRSFVLRLVFRHFEWRRELVEKEIARQKFYEDGRGHIPHGSL